ncbi:MAG: sugar phosphate isomerase/epimerase [Bacteroidetes bacterium]|nr:sugar phosphate isomerase/epimerase [Bacteroidota bacterium]
MPVTRRKFIATTAAAAMLNPLASLAKPKFKAAEGFSLKILATNWGFNGNWDAFCEKAKTPGYDGVEVWLPAENDRRPFLEATAKHGLSFGFLCGSGESDFGKHFAQFEKMLTDAVAMRPLYFNCHSGRDWFDFEQNRKFIDLGLDVAKSSGVPVYHETHRGRIMFAAHVTRRFMEAYPGLRLTLDISHWCNVHESLLGDQAETVELALSRTDHIHARIGHAEGPQVNDPRAPEWDSAVKAHFAWWDKVVQRKAAEGKPMTILTEFGPPTYLPTVPYTFQPLADQWGINVHMLKTLRERYKL